MKAIWNGAIGFGLVNIPVKIFSASEDSSLDLDMLDRKDHANIHFKRVNEKTGKEVPWDNIVKGYLLKDHYVIIEDKDFEAASPEKTRILSIQQFVKESEIDSIYFEAPYYLEPQKNGEQAYSLLLEALKKTKMAGVGTFVLRNKELAGVIRPYQDKVLLLSRLRFHDQLRDYNELRVLKKTVKPAELKMAVTLIQQLSQTYNPAAFKDTYTEALLKIIKAKASGKKMAQPRVKAVSSKTIDLMAQLKASLEPKAKSKKAS